MGPGLSPHLEAQRIQALHSLDLLSGPAPAGLDDLCHQAQAEFRVAVALVTLIGHEQQIIKASAGTTPEATLRADAFCDHLLRSEEVLVVPDAREDPRFAANPLVTGEPFIRFYAGAPLIYRRDIHLGGFCLLDPQPRKLSAEEQAKLADLAEEAMICIFEQVFDRFTHDV